MKLCSLSSLFTHPPAITLNPDDPPNSHSANLDRTPTGSKSRPNPNRPIAIEPNPRTKPQSRPNPNRISISIEKMEKYLEESGNLAMGREFCQNIAHGFNRSSGRAGKPVIKWTEIQSWFQTRLQGSTEMPKDQECRKGKGIRDSSELEFEARSSTDGAWYDVEKFLAHRFDSTGEAEVRIRFIGFGPEEDEWINIKSAVRERSVPLENNECCKLKVGDQVLCFQERRDRAIHYDAHVMEIQRRVHDIRGCRCLFLIRYDHDESEERVRLRRLSYRRR
ncbi:hypothetical protein RIF29_27000 [Crotalaria pallida]|uniref:SAWADEE domain-containing protein n=1 Tax=Crotalaria pallida TaxID=3830 RepID=A0AAN9I0N3_CROPI